MVQNAAGQDPLLDASPFPDQIIWRVGVADAFHILVDNWPFVEIAGDVMCRGADHLDAAGVCLMIGPGPFEARQEAMMNVDAAIGKEAAEIFGKDLHIACQNNEIAGYGVDERKIKRKMKSRLEELKMTVMRSESLEAAIRQAGNAVELLRNGQRRAFSHGTVSGQFTNWQSEVDAWRTTCGFMDQSHHMVDHYVKGPGAFGLLKGLAVNSFENFHPGMAKQFVAATPDGYYLGDCVLFYLEDELFNLVGRPTSLDWVQYHVETGSHDVTTERDPQSMDRGGRPPVVYRYELQGPLAGALMEKLTGQPLPNVKFFGMTDFEIAGKRVRALRHGMAGAVGFEIFGPWEEGDAVRDAILSAGQEFGLLRVGSTAYSTANLESGWVPGPLPAIFSGDSMKSYREWLPAKAAGSLAGSYNPQNIADYYVTPFDLDYDRIVKFDHDFLGSEALQEHARHKRRKKVTLVWDGQDMARIVASAWSDGPRYKYFNMPKARYGLYQMDQVLVDGKPAGISLDCGYLANERKIVSLAVIDEEFAETGTEVTVLWGENPISLKPQVEPHEQTEVKATVAPAPYSAQARTKYRK